MTDQAHPRMTAAEFMALPESNFPTELINGEIVMSPTPKHTHQRVVLALAIQLSQIVSDGEVVVSPSDVHFDENTVLQPDVFWVSASNQQCQVGK